MSEITKIKIYFQETSKTFEKGEKGVESIEVELSKGMIDIKYVSGSK